MTTKTFFAEASDIQEIERAIILKQTLRIIALSISCMSDASAKKFLLSFWTRILLTRFLDELAASKPKFNGYPRKHDHSIDIRITCFVETTKRIFRIREIYDSLVCSHTMRSDRAVDQK
jgi:hypothetical protein